MPESPLILHDDGSYQIWGEEGTYELVQAAGDSRAFPARGLGQVVNPREIVFEYRVGDKSCKALRRIFEPLPDIHYPERCATKPRSISA